jgi:hypothetical protein
MFKLNPDQQRGPIGGHRYIERGHTITGATAAEVIRRLRDYRVNNHIPVGDPEQDVLTYYAMNWPWTIKVDRSSEPAGENAAFVQYRQWVERTWAKPPNKFVPSKEAAARLDACAKCPFRCKKQWDKTREATELDRRAFLLARGIDFPNKGGVCRLNFFADLVALALIETPRDFVEARKEKTKPEWCWV